MRHCRQSRPPRTSATNELWVLVQPLSAPSDRRDGLLSGQGSISIRFCRVLASATVAIIIDRRHLANAWGVGDPVEENGVLVLVSLDERRTEVVTQEAISIPGEEVAAAATEHFAEEEWEAGLLAIIDAVEGALAAPYEEIAAALAGVATSSRTNPGTTLALSQMRRL